VVDLLRRIAAINAEVAKSPAARPGKLWRRLNEKHASWLQKYGIENFKRHVSFNYYSWLTTSLTHPHLCRLKELWPVHRSRMWETDTLEVPQKEEMPPCYRDLLLKDDVRGVYCMGVSLLWDYTVATDRHGILERLEEPLAGNPLRILRGERMLSQDLAHSVRERNTICEHVDGPLVIGELGAGHGRLANVFHRTTQCRYLIFDIAPALVVSQWYVENVFPQEKVFRFRPFSDFDEIADELAQCRFGFFSANQLELFPDNYFNVFINVCSLMEMRLESIVHFSEQIARVTHGWFYTKQRVEEVNVSDDVVVLKEDYPALPGSRLILDREDEIDSRQFQQLWQLE
jgi:putative sugar O-methyltransferase